MFCCFRGWEKLSSNMKGLIVNTVFFTALTVVQLVFGIFVGSVALIADASAMFVDVTCYLLAIGGEAINPEKARTKRIYDLVVSFLSLAALFALSVYFLYASIDGMVNPPPPSDEEEDAVYNTGLVMVLFGLLGILVDGVCLAYAFWWPKYQKRKEEAKQQGATTSATSALLAKQVTAGSLSRSMKVTNELGMRRSTILLQISPAERLDNVDIADGETHNINTLAAYAHTVADCIRSLTTIIAGIIILVDNLREATADGVAGAIASSTIAVGAILGFWEWIANLRDHLKAEKAREYMLNGHGEKDDDERDSEIKAAFEKRSTAFSSDESSRDGHYIPIEV